MITLTITLTNDTPIQEINTIHNQLLTTATQHKEHITSIDLNHNQY